ncbi:MAG TPA: 30S ribosomal protein S17 [Dehalococcoidia bacterium]|jgi:small subunit ribosomal protein S17|nr:30S ribosomal protein S17 [Dehalococcoidia bacterium]
MGSLEKAQIGTVVANKMDKTVVVRIDRYKRHRLYRKTLRVTQRYKAHDEKNECRLGDIVRIAETRPLSRDKRWRVVEIITRGDVAEVAPREIGANIIEETRAAAEAEAAAARAAAPAAGEGPAVEIVDDTPMAPPEQLDQLAEDAAETREDGEA